MNKSFRIALASFAVTAALIKAAPALAEPVAGEPAVTIVRTADIDLTSAAGRRLLETRLVAAAREVCGSPSDLDLEGKNEARKCRSETLARARADSSTVLASSSIGKVVAVTASR